MENKNVGWLILGLSAVVIVIVFLFNNALKDIVKASCGLEHGKSCPMYSTITQQTYLALAIVGILIIIAIVLIFSKPTEKIIVKKVRERKKAKRFDLSDFRPEEKKVFGIIRENRAIFQADLIEKSGFGKVKISRILDRLEGHKLVERKRRGMTNVVILAE